MIVTRSDDEDEPHHEETNACYSRRIVALFDWIMLPLDEILGSVRPGPTARRRSARAWSITSKCDIARLHGGDVSCESTLGEGGTFRVSLRLGEAD